MKQLQPRVRFSNLKHMSKSPAHYRASIEQQYSPSKAMRIGWLADALFYGSKLPPIWDGERRGNAWKDFRDRHDGAEIYTQSEVDQARPIAEALRGHPRAYDLLSLGAHRQRRVEWSWLGRECQGTPDVAGSGSVVELKTTTNAEPTWFQRHAIQLGYHAQLWWYRNGLVQMGEIRAATCLIVAVEQKQPYAISIHRLTERTLELGERCCRAWMERLLVCEESDSWPGYTAADCEMDAMPDVDLTLDGEEV